MVSRQKAANGLAVHLAAEAGSENVLFSVEAELRLEDECYRGQSEAISDGVLSAAN